MRALQLAQPAEGWCCRKSLHEAAHLPINTVWWPHIKLDLMYETVQTQLNMNWLLAPEALLGTCSQYSTPGLYQHNLDFHSTGYVP